MTRLGVLLIVTTVLFVAPQIAGQTKGGVAMTGDFIGEGPPDIFYTHSHRYALLLSSLARDGQFVGEAGAFQKMIC
jgi:hypothetical protein